MKPPPLPQEVLTRVLRVARFDGISVAAVASAGAILSAAGHSGVGALVGVLAAAAGALELAGASMLRSGDERGMGYLVYSQLALMGVILGYVALQLLHMDIEPLRAYLTTDMIAQIRSEELSIDDFLVTTYRLTYFAVAAVTVLYQGAMAFYYMRRRSAVLTAVRLGVEES